MLYEYRCRKCQTISTDFVVYVREMKQEIMCEGCGCPAQKIVSQARFKLAWVPTVVDTAKEIWDGSALEGTDGINPLTYKSDKIQVDGGHKIKHGGDKRATRSPLASSAME